ncbi:MAG: hypothetical protein IKC10_05790 [Alphaproteobacteria bacterium]|nr:hypothetical protein [Alphaproteobacteria bacterium]
MEVIVIALALTIVGRVLFLSEKRKVKSWEIKNVNEDFYEVCIERNGVVYTALVPVEESIDEAVSLKIEGFNKEDRTFLCKSVNM